MPSSGVPFRWTVRTMPKAVRSSPGSYSFPLALAAWLGQNGDLLNALAAVRRLGAEGAEAVRAVLGIRQIAEVRASWQLWAALTEGDGEDPESLLLRVLPLDHVERARRALWGPSWRDGEVPTPDPPPASG